MKLEHTIHRTRARVEMIPLIDCVFIILVFFIYSMLSMTVQRGLSVQLPTARVLQGNQDLAVVITITGDGMLMVDDDAVSFDGLRGALEQALAGQDPPRVVVNADASSRHAWFVRVMDAVSAAGITEVVILADEEDDAR